MFGEFLQKDSFELEFERLGIRTAVEPLSEDELEECRRMRGTDGARYALYLACPALHEEGEKLYKEGKIFSPLDITMAISAADVNGAYRFIREISGVGESRVNLYKNDRPAFGADEIFDEISGNWADNGETADFMDYSDGFSQNMSTADEKGHNVTDFGEMGNNMSDNAENGRALAKNGVDMDKIAELLAYKLRMAASNM